MADVAVNLQNEDGKVKDQSTGLVHPYLMAKEDKKKDIEDSTILEPIMVKDALGKKCIYYFEEGNHHLLEVIERETEAYLPQKIQEIEVDLKRLWREILSILRLFTSFIVIFFVEFVFYAIHYLLQPLVLNSVTIIGNHLLKPLLITVFNNIVTPITTFVWNVLVTVVTTVNPAMELVSRIVKEVVRVLESFRLFNINYHGASTPGKVEAV